MTTPSNAETQGELSSRQAGVLRALVNAWVGEAAPVGSRRISHLLSEHLSPASIRTTLAELAELGLVEQPHTSAGRVPSDQGLRVFVDTLLESHDLGRFERRDLEGSLDSAGGEGVVAAAADLLSARTHQLGFAVVPRLERVVLRHLSLVRMSRERVLAVIVSQTGETYRRVIEEPGDADQAELDRIALLLNEAAAGHTLGRIRTLLEEEAAVLRRRAGRLLERALRLGACALVQPESDESELLFATRLALLDQPEFQDPSRVRELMRALETREQLIAVVDKMIEQGASVAIGSESEEPVLRHFSLVTAPYGPEGARVGIVGVIGPSRMDYGRVIPTVTYLSELVSHRYHA